MCTSPDRRPNGNDTGTDTVPDGMDEVVEEFLVESLENLDQLDRDLVELERDPANREAIASIFRVIHTIKGTCGFLGFSTLESITHVGENLLSRLRDGSLSIDAEIADALLAMTDAVRAILADIERDGAESSTDYGSLVDRLAALHDREEPGHEEVSHAGDPNEHENEPERIGEQFVAQGLATEVDVALGLIEQGAGDPRHLGEILVEQGVLDPPQVRDALEQQIDQRSGIADSTIRVDVGLLDDLMNLVGELVLTRNQILQWGAARAVDSMFVSTSQRLNLITTELQARMMKTRMQPVSNVWGKFPRVVRDLASKCGKQVTVVMEGQDTELDKTVIEAIKDPLTHLVRNAVDHGVENPEDRRARGKSENGVLQLRAYHEGGQVNIEIADDGNGIDVERVKAKALERGLVRPDELESLGERETLGLIFTPGFSTAEAVTAVSGRGVGMDVVKTNIERIGGSLDVSSRPGRGTTFRIKIPLTLAIIPALVVTTSSDRFAIPQVNLLELVRLEPGGPARIEYVQGAPVYRLRGDILPLVSLRDELKLADISDADGEEQSVNIIVLQAEDRQFGLLVDDINDTEEIVVKPLAPQLQSIAVFSGCTIMGDGSVALILDVLGLAQRAGVLSERGERRLAEVDVADHADDDEQSLLVVGLGGDARGAVPLALVHRLEELDASVIEHSAGREVVQYRGGIMPLVRVADVLGIGEANRRGRLELVVFDDGGQNVGIVVDEVLDIVRLHVPPARAGGRPGIRGNVVINGRVADVLDVPEIIARADALRAPAGRVVDASVGAPS